MLAAVDIDRGGLDRMRGEAGFSGRCLAVAADVSQAADAQRAVEQVLAELGRLDILINSAGSQWAARGQKR